MNKSAKIAIFALLLMLGISACSDSHIRMRFEGTSMLPAYKHGDRLLLETGFGEIKRGDVIAFNYPVDTTKGYIRRVVGMPGETISTEGGILLIDGKPLTESYVDPQYSQEFSTSSEFKIPSDSYYVLGDNRDNSYDSRFFGAVKRKFVVGKVVRTY